MGQYIDLGVYREAVRDNIAKAFNVECINTPSSQQEQAVEKGHNVGDIHPNGKWVWSKTASGYDWRVIKK